MKERVDLLPPGYMFSEQWSEDGFIGVTGPNGLFFTGAATHEEVAAAAWKKWLPPGITREQWKAMEGANARAEAAESAIARVERTCKWRETNGCIHERGLCREIRRAIAGKKGGGDGHR